MEEDEELNIKQFEIEGQSFINENLSSVFEDIGKGHLSNAFSGISQAYGQNIVCDQFIRENDEYSAKARYYRSLLVKSVDRIYGKAAHYDFVRAFLDYVCKDYHGAQVRFSDPLNDIYPALAKYFNASCLFELGHTEHAFEEINLAIKSSPHPRNFFLKAKIVCPYGRTNHHELHNKREYIENALSAYFINYRSVKAYELVFKYALEEGRGMSLPEFSRVELLENKMPNCNELFRSLMLKVSFSFFPPREKLGTSIDIDVHSEDALDFVIDLFANYENGTKSLEKQEIEQWTDDLLGQYSLNDTVHNNYLSWYHSHLKHQYRDETDPYDSTNDFPDAPVACDACGSAPCMCSDPERTSTTYRG